MFRKTKSIISFFLVLSIMTLSGCTKQEKEINNTTTTLVKEEKKEVQTIVEDIKFTVDSVEKLRDYEEKETLVLSVTYKNLTKENIIIDSQDVTVTQGGYLLKNTYDELLGTTAYYLEVKPDESKTFKIGYRLEGESTDIKLTFKPFLSKKKLQVDLRI